jgi:hypothetical protein
MTLQPKNRFVGFLGSNRTLIVVITLLSLISFLIGVTNGSILQGLSIGGSLLLTGTLVVLYRQQRDILKRQSELTEAGQRALLRVLTYQLFSWADLYKYGLQENDIQFVSEHLDGRSVLTAAISNPGRGYAENMRAELKISSPNYTSSVASPLTARTNTDQLAFQEGEGGIMPPEENEPMMYRSKFSFTEADLPEDFNESGVTTESLISPSELLWILGDLGEPKAKIGIFIHYRDGTGVRKPKQLLTTECELGDYQNITTLWRHGEPIPGEVEPEYNLGQELE